MMAYPNNSEARINSSMAVSARSAYYGAAIGVDGEYISVIDSRRVSLKDRAKFAFGELVTGPLFVAALSLFMVLSRWMGIDYKASVKSATYVMAKRTIDILVASAGLILALPLFVLIPILIKLDSNGSIFYTQERVGLNRRRRDRRDYSAGMKRERRLQDRRQDNLMGRPFRVIKFRTMVSNAEAKTGAVWATKNDSRVTRVGRFLRKTRIDEIPQLINVLRGEMAMVGPRPERPVFVKDLATKVPEYSTRLDVKPGITGRAQVDNGYDTSVESVMAKVRSDVDYIRTWNVWSDIKILMKTVVVVITGKGAC